MIHHGTIQSVQWVGQRAPIFLYLVMENAAARTAISRPQECISITAQPENLKAEDRKEEMPWNRQLKGKKKV
jgi:hypothetical protein